MDNVNFSEIDKKWQEEWERARIFEAKPLESGKKFYCLEMYPYPSGGGLHMGHARNYIIGDIYARFKRMQGLNVLYPMGYDSFGLPAENAAIKANSHPKIFTDNAIQSFIKQQKQLGLSYDWSRMIMSHDPEYYKWDQWIFLEFLKKGLAYRKKAPVNFCESCQTVLANEQVISGKCWRCNNDVRIKSLEQWFFKITNYAEELLKGIEKLDWPERIKVMQKNWIGKSSGAEINFKIKDTNKKISIFTTRADTVFGVTFLVFAPEHPLVDELIKGNDNEAEIRDFIKKVVIEERFLRTADEKEKEGIFIGRYAVNPLTQEEIPVYIANFVLQEYGGGAVMAVPAHDARDFEFAKRYDLKIKRVIAKSKEDSKEEVLEAYTEEGILINSKQFTGLNSELARGEIAEYLKKNKLGRKKTEYKLRDWLVSRQRYWGCPIPVIYCEKCGMVPVPESQLPVLLPLDVRFTGQGSPLAASRSFSSASCPNCKSKARRETDTMDTFVDSSWYFLRYCDSGNKNKAFDRIKAEHWMPVDQYIGGAEHAVMHLIYARFFTKALRDLGLVNINEPFMKLFNQGMLHKGGYVMSKSRGNIITQDEIVSKYGVDTARFFLMSVASPDKEVEWSDDGMEGAFRFIKKIYEFCSAQKKTTLSNERADSKMHSTIAKVTEEIENFQYNMAIIHLRDYFGYMQDNSTGKENISVFLKLLAPFCPHIAEELWHNIGNKSFISAEKWPQADKSRINNEFEKQDEAENKLTSDIKNILNIVSSKGKAVSKVYIYSIPAELNALKSSAEKLGRAVGKEVIILASNDKAKYDPEHKASKAKPGKPAIYME